MPEISEYARAAGDAFAELIATVEQLRDPGGCPWDAEQTYISLRQHTLEEMYELLDAVDSADVPGIEEELGDLMTHLAFYTDIARRQNDFDAVTTARKVQEKLIRRHPHVFADAAELTSADEVVDQWEQLKRNESGKSSAVASLPASMPALALAASVQRRTVKTGVRWPDTDTPEPIFTRDPEESEESAEERAAELLMQLAREVRQSGIDPEIALRTAAVRLRNRVLRAERIANGVPLAELDDAERARAWQQSENED